MIKFNIYLLQRNQQYDKNGRPAILLIKNKKTSLIIKGTSQYKTNLINLLSIYNNNTKITTYFYAQSIISVPTTSLIQIYKSHASLTYTEKIRLLDNLNSFLVGRSPFFEKSILNEKYLTIQKENQKLKRSLLLYKYKYKIQTQENQNIKRSIKKLKSLKESEMEME